MYSNGLPLLHQRSGQPRGQAPTRPVETLFFRRRCAHTTSSMPHLSLLQLLSTHLLFPLRFSQVLCPWKHLVCSLSAYLLSLKAQEMNNVLTASEQIQILSSLATRWPTHPLHHILRSEPGHRILVSSTHPLLHFPTSLRIASAQGRGTSSEALSRLTSALSDTNHTLSSMVRGVNRMLRNTRSTQEAAARAEAASRLTMRPERRVSALFPSVVAFSRI